MQKPPAHRMPLFGNRATTERSRDWRAKFRKQCTERIQGARQDQIDRRRQEKAIQIAVLEEWEKFKRMHEEALENEGILDVDYFLQDEEEDEYEAYKATTCVNCQSHTLRKVEPFILQCPACGFRAAEEKIHRMQEAQTKHASYCHGRIQYTPEPGSDALYGLCDTCDLWEIY